MRPYSQTAIRVFDLTGERLYETWHDGEITGAKFRRGGKLMFCGGDSDLSLEEKNPGLRNAFPLIVFCLDARPGSAQNDHFLVESGIRRASDLAWYKWLGPPALLKKLDTLGTVSIGFRTGQVGVFVENEVILAYAFDDSGEFESHLLLDSYRRNRDSLPDVDEFKWFEYESLFR